MKTPFNWVGNKYNYIDTINDVVKIKNIIPNKIIISIFFRILSPIFNYSIKYVIMIWVII